MSISRTMNIDTNPTRLLNADLGSYNFQLDLVAGDSVRVFVGDTERTDFTLDIETSRITFTDSSNYPASDADVRIERVVPLTQDTALSVVSSTLPNRLELGLDKLTRIAQDLARDLLVHNGIITGDINATTLGGEGIDYFATQASVATLSQRVDDLPALPDLSNYITATQLTEAINALPDETDYSITTMTLNEANVLNIEQLNNARTLSVDLSSLASGGGSSDDDIASFTAPDSSNNVPALFSRLTLTTNDGTNITNTGVRLLNQNSLPASIFISNDNLIYRYAGSNLYDITMDISTWDARYASRADSIASIGRVGATIRGRNEDGVLLDNASINKDDLVAILGDAITGTGTNTFIQSAFYQKTDSTTRRIITNYNDDTPDGEIDLQGFYAEILQDVPVRHIRGTGDISVAGSNGTFTISYTGSGGGTGGLSNAQVITLGENALTNDTTTHTTSISATDEAFSLASAGTTSKVIPFSFTIGDGESAKVKLNFNLTTGTTTNPYRSPYVELTFNGDTRTIPSFAYDNETYFLAQGGTHNATFTIHNAGTANIRSVSATYVLTSAWVDDVDDLINAVIQADDLASKAYADNLVKTLREDLTTLIPVDYATTEMLEGVSNAVSAVDEKANANKQAVAYNGHRIDDIEALLSEGTLVEFSTLQFDTNRPLEDYSQRKFNEGLFNYTYTLADSTRNYTETRYINQANHTTPYFEITELGVGHTLELEATTPTRGQDGNRYPATGVPPQGTTLMVSWQETANGIPHARTEPQSWDGQSELLAVSNYAGIDANITLQYLSNGHIRVRENLGSQTNNAINHASIKFWVSWEKAESQTTTHEPVVVNVPEGDVRNIPDDFLWTYENLRVREAIREGEYRVFSLDVNDDAFPPNTTISAITFQGGQFKYGVVLPAPTDLPVYTEGAGIDISEDNVVSIDTTGASANEVLSYTGSGFDWVGVFDGSYNALSGKPTILTTAQVNNLIGVKALVQGDNITLTESNGTFTINSTTSGGSAFDGTYGTSNTNAGSNAVAMGAINIADTDYAVALGRYSNTTADDVMAVGYATSSSASAWSGLRVKRNGDLVQVKSGVSTTINASGGGGATYTAGSGVAISSSNVISATDELQTAGGTITSSSTLTHGQLGDTEVITNIPTTARGILMDVGQSSSRQGARIQPTIVMFDRYAQGATIAGENAGSGYMIFQSFTNGTYTFQVGGSDIWFALAGFIY